MKLQNVIFVILLFGLTSCNVRQLSPDDKSETAEITVKLHIPEEYAGIMDVADINVSLQSSSLPVNYIAAPSDSDTTVSFCVAQGKYSILASYSDKIRRIYANSMLGEFLLTDEGIVKSDGQYYVNLAELTMSVALPSPIVIREFYYHGSMTADGSTNYTKDRYIEIYNNNGEGGETYYLDGLCIAAIFPYNSTAGNTAWLGADTLAIGSFYWSIPGGGKDYPLKPGESAVVACIAAVDHSTRSTSGLHLEKAHFGCYDESLSGHEIDASVPRMIKGEGGQGTAWALSIHSPALVLFRPEMGLEQYRQHPEIWERYEPGKTSGIKYWYIASSWILDGVECYDTPVNALKRLPSAIDVSYACMQSGHYSGKCITRKLDEDASTASVKVYVDTNNSREDFLTDQILQPNLRK